MDPVEHDRLERVRRWGVVPPAERGDEWIREFEGAFWPSFVVARPGQVSYGIRDSRPYRVASPCGTAQEDVLPGLETRPTRAAALVGELIEHGQGLLFGLPGGEPLCVFTLGEVLAYRLYGRAFTPPLSTSRGDGVIEAGATLHLAPPHEANFPSAVRINVRRHLRAALGIDAPRAAWVRLPDGRSGLAFDLGVDRGIEAARRREAFEGLRWFLPARMPYFVIDELAKAAEMRPF